MAMGKGQVTKSPSKAEVGTTSSNSFSALIDAAEDAGTEETSTSRPRSSGKLQHPLVWIDLEMTGGSGHGACQETDAVN